MIKISAFFPVKGWFSTVVLVFPLFTANPFMDPSVHRLILLFIQCQSFVLVYLFLLPRIMHSSDGKKDNFLLMDWSLWKLLIGSEIKSDTFFTSCPSIFLSPFVNTSVCLINDCAAWNPSTDMAGRGDEKKNHQPTPIAIS